MIDGILVSLLGIASFYRKDFLDVRIYYKLLYDYDDDDSNKIIINLRRD